MRKILLVALALTVAAGTALAAEPKKKAKAGTAECTILIGPFRGKKNADVKDEQLNEYAPLMKSYWQKGCSSKLYEEEIQDPDLRKRLDAAAPHGGKRAKKAA
jgi:hypothetical protein